MGCNGIHKKVKTMDFKEMNPLGIIGIIGAIILVVGVFLTWWTPDVAGAKNYSGWDIWNNVDNCFKARTYESGAGTVKYSGFPCVFLPLVALICGIISIVLMIIPTIMSKDKLGNIGGILGLIALILAVVVVICGILFYTGSVTTDLTIAGVTTSTSAKITEGAKIGIGFWLVLVGGIITMIGGLMPILKDKGIIKI